MSFHKYIIGSFVVFIALMAYLSVRSFQTDVNLVTTNYYEKELKYEDHMEAVAATMALPEQPSISLNSSDKQLVFQMPRVHSGSNFEVLLFRPSDRYQDKKFSYNKSTFGLDYSALMPGMWEVQISWDNGGQHFYYEEDIRL
jgi:nitrogen fixation protein FixH